MSFGWAMVIALVLLIGNAFFVGAEFALISARQTQIEPRAQAGSRAARTTLRAMGNVSLMMAGAQLGITMCSIGLGAVAEPALARLIEPLFAAIGIPEILVHPIAIALALAVVVSLHMILGEMVPKNLAIASPERSAIILGPALYAIVIVLRPIIWFLNGTANLVLRGLRVPVRGEVDTSFTQDEVAGLLEESRRHGFLDQEELELLTGALGFVEVKAGDVALPVSDLVIAADSATPQDLERLCVSTGFSRFPIRNELGLITGYVHVKDLIAINLSKADRPLEHRWVRTMPVVRSTDSLQSVLSTMQRRGVHLVRVIDPETQQLLGLAMMEDVLEKLVGEVVT
jgi:CBS domain containing-hemolysin-like protein